MFWKSACFVAAVAFAWQLILRIYTTTAEWKDSNDPVVAATSAVFQAKIIQHHRPYKISKRGNFQWDLKTFVWNRFADKFGSNFNTPYMYAVLPLGILGGLPSPMWRLRHNEAVVLIATRPPPVEYFSITPFVLWTRKRGFVFASLGDSVNALNMHDGAGEGGSVFAYVVVTQASRHVLQTIRQALVQSGVTEASIHVAVVPSQLIDEDDWAVFEVVMRLFQFKDQELGDAYLRANHPVFYIQGPAPDVNIDSTQILPMPSYKDRRHPDHVDEPTSYGDRYRGYQESLMKRLFSSLRGKIDANESTNMTSEKVDFAPIYIRGLHCLQNGTQCLGDCPDATYLGSHIQTGKEDVPSLRLSEQDELHVVTMLDHRFTQTATYSSVALMKSKTKVLKKSHMDIRGTPIGVLSNRKLLEKQRTRNDENAPFFAWIITRNPDHCEAVRDNMIDGCTVVSEQELKLQSFLAYCERLYLNPVTKTGQDWDKILPAQLYHIRNIPQQKTPLEMANTENAVLYHKIRMPSSDVSLKVFDGNEPLRFLHIIKTGGEAFEGYLWSQSNLHMDYASCRKASVANLTSSTATAATAKSFTCLAAATTISTMLCGVNCECCAADLHEEGRFHGAMLRSPRAHTISMFMHGHNAHHTTLSRIAADFPLYLVESILRGVEYACNHSGTGGVPDWLHALSDNLKQSLQSSPLRDRGQTKPTAASTDASGVHVISLRNTQSHSLTCGKATKGSLGQHFRVMTRQTQSEANHESEVADSLEPDLAESLRALERLEFVGITELFHTSLCLLHYQASQTLPLACDCQYANHHTKNPSRKPLGHWVEYRNKRRETADLPQNVLEMIDDHTTVDSKIFSAALRLFLGRLRKVEELTGTSISPCIDWTTLRSKTDYIPGLWEGPESLLMAEPGMG